MFRKINVPLLGIVENMSHYECPACGHKEHIFGEEGALRTAEAMKMDVLGQVSPCGTTEEKRRQQCCLTSPTREAALAQACCEAACRRL